MKSSQAFSAGMADIYGAPRAMPPDAAAIYASTNARFAARVTDAATDGDALDEVREHIATATAEELEVTAANHRALIKVISNERDDDGSLPARQERRLEHAENVLALVEAKLSESRGRKSKPEALASDRRNSASEWQTPDGTRVPVLAPQARLADLHPAPRDEQRNTPSIGQTVVALLTGNWGDFSPRNALSEGLSPDGGYLVQPALSRQMIDLARDSSIVVRAGARTVAMPTSEFDLLRVTGDPTIGWFAENQTITGSGPTFGRLKFRARKMACLIPISRELVEDAANAPQEIERLMRLAMGQELDRAALFGDGSDNEPTGLFNAAGVQEISGMSPPESITWDALLDAIQLVEDVNGVPNAYAVNARKKRILAGQKDQELRYISAPTDVAALAHFTTNKLANTQAVLGDFAQILIGARTGVELTVSTDAKFAEDQLVLKIRWRGDVQFAQPQHLVKFTGLA